MKRFLVPALALCGLMALVVSADARPKLAVGVTVDSPDDNATVPNTFTVKGTTNGTAVDVELRDKTTLALVDYAVPTVDKTGNWSTTLTGFGPNATYWVISTAYLGMASDSDYRVVTCDGTR